MRNLFSAALLSVLLLTSKTFALGDPRPLFEAIKNAGVDYVVVGAVCEQATKALMQKQYGPQFTVLTGVEYARSQGSTLGELDVVVVRNADQKVLLVGEVKCWKDLKAAKKKANDQRQRIITNLKNANGLHLACLDKTCHFNAKNFDQVQRFISISQDGGRQFGFELDLPYSLEQLMTVREALIKCQRNGDCKRPSSPR